MVTVVLLMYTVYALPPVRTMRKNCCLNNSVGIGEVSNLLRTASTRDNYGTVLQMVEILIESRNRLLEHSGIFWNFLQHPRTF